MRRKLLSEAQNELLRAWWESLQPEEEEGGVEKKDRRYPYGRKERAMIRRADGLDELLSYEAVIRLAQDLARLGGIKDEVPFWYYEQVALAAGVIANVRKDAADDQTLAVSLGSAQGGADRSVMSELRFRALQRCRRPEDLLKHLRRAVKLADGAACVVRLANDVIAWQQEMRNSLRKGARSVRFAWATDYYMDVRDRLPAPEQNEQPEI